MLTMNLDYWKSLGKDQQEAVLKAAKETEEYQWNISKKKMEDALKIIQQHGMIVENTTPALEKAMKKAALKIINKFMKRAKGKEKALLEKYVNAK
jgi:TRAP-type C4-dicarboxylate transport system substrate-binding protein